jgi:hypothetical protein
VLPRVGLAAPATIATFALALIGCAGDEGSDATPTNAAATPVASNDLDRVVKIDGERGLT